MVVILHCENNKDYSPIDTMIMMMKPGDILKSKILTDELLLYILDNSFNPVKRPFIFVSIFKFRNESLQNILF